MAYEKRDLSERLIQFSAAVVRLLNELPGTMPAKKIADQVMRSATSVGANFEEARGSESRADFCHKLGVALKEMRETRYWLCLIEAAEMVEDKGKIAKIVDEASQLRAILGKSTATAKGTAKNSGTKSSEL